MCPSKGHTKGKGRSKPVWTLETDSAEVNPTLHTSQSSTEPAVGAIDVPGIGAPPLEHLSPGDALEDAAWLFGVEGTES